MRWTHWIKIRTPTGSRTGSRTEPCGRYDPPGPGEELTGETNPLEQDTDGDGLIDGLDEDLNGNGRSTSPRPTHAWSTPTTRAGWFRSVRQ